MRNSMTIAYLEDDHDQAKTVSQWLDIQGMNCVVFEQPDALKSALETFEYDAIMLDVQIHGEDSGLALLDHIRQFRNASTPVLMVSSSAYAEQALKGGADDFLEKPLRKSVLLAHIHRLLRPISSQSTIENYPPYQINVVEQRITLKGNPVDLSDEEFKIASTLFRHFGKVVSYQHLLDKAHGQSSTATPHKLESDLQRLKRKMGFRGHDGWRLEPVYRHGMRLVNAEYDPR